MGMDRRLVFAKATGRSARAVSRAATYARRVRGRQLRSAPAADQDSAKSHQRRLTSVRAELLPPLPPGRAARGSGGYVDEPCRLSLHHQKRERPMSNDDTGDGSSLKKNS